MTERDKQIQARGYLITHHLRDLDRYVCTFGRGPKIKVYALLRNNRKYASVTARADKEDWPANVQEHIRKMLQEACSPVITYDRFQREPMIYVNAREAKTDYVIPSKAEPLCQALAKYLKAFTC